MNRWGQIWIYGPDDPNSLRRRVRVLMRILAVVLILLWWVFVVFPKMPAGDGNIVVSQLQSDFEKIAPPRGTSLIGKESVSSKTSAALVEGRYFSQIPEDAVIASYTAALNKDGWEYLGTRRFGASREVEFCKRDLEASIDVTSMELDGQPYFYFSEEWPPLDCTSKSQDSH